MDFDGICYLMMAERATLSPRDHGEPGRTSTCTGSPWSDLSELDWPDPSTVQEGSVPQQRSLYEGACGVDEADGGFDPLDDPDLIGERLSKSLEFDPANYDAQPYLDFPKFDSLDSSHDKSVQLQPAQLDKLDTRQLTYLPNTAQNYLQSGHSQLGRVANGDGHSGIHQNPPVVQPKYYPVSDDDEVDDSDTDHSDQGEKIKVKLLSVWNNMKHGFTVKTKTNFKYDSPVILLGKCYCCSRQEREEQKHKTVETISAIEHFKKDFFSKIWFTYRKDFGKLYGSQLTSDVGWGCMLRSGQMIIAQAFVMHYLTRDWILHHGQQNRKESVLHQQIIRLFGDQPIDVSPFSLHRLVRIGVDHGKRPGDWYGPASVAYVLRDAIDQGRPDINPLLMQLCIYVAPDCTVYIQDIIDLCTKPSPHSKPAPSSRPPSSSQSEEASDSHWRAAIVLVPVRLGGESLNPIYGSCVQSILAHSACLGIIGGKPKHSLYFIGWQDEKLIYLDPHFCQDVVDMRLRDFPTSTFHCSAPRKMALTKMDPSCTLGFYVPSRSALNDLVTDLKKLISPPKDQGIYPLFVFNDGRSIDLERSQPAQEASLNRYLRVRHLDKKGRVKQPSTESEDFVFL